ncbi:UNVERIFIED_CONTAM: hypothetical protein NCL1_32536 [Trichonephila clavipes]
MISLQMNNSPSKHGILKKLYDMLETKVSYLKVVQQNLFLCALVRLGALRVQPPPRDAGVYVTPLKCRHFKTLCSFVINTPDNANSVAFSQCSSSPRLIEDETFNDSVIINNLIDYEDGQEKPDPLRWMTTAVNTEEKIYYPRTILFTNKKFILSYHKICFGIITTSYLMIVSFVIFETRFLHKRFLQLKILIEKLWGLSNDCLSRSFVATVTYGHGFMTDVS